MVLKQLSSHLEKEKVKPIPLNRINQRIKSLNATNKTIKVLGKKSIEFLHVTGVKITLPRLKI